MSEQDKVPEKVQEEAGKVFQSVVSEDQIKQLVNDEIYIYTVFQRYLDKLDNENDKQMFVTLTEGLVAKAQREKKVITRDGELSYLSICESAYNALTERTSDVKEPTEEEVEAKKEATKGDAIPSSRQPGDVTPADEEYETADTPLANPEKYAEVRTKFLTKLKTNKDVVENKRVISDLLND